jgi:DNA-binding XRE family transcriptional regulator
MSPRGSTRPRKYGVFLKPLRKREGDLKQEAFAHFVGISPSLLRAIESGNRNPTWRVVDLLVQAFPDEKDDIVKAAIPFMTLPKQKPSVLPSTFRSVEDLARNGELDEAWKVLMAEFRRDSDCLQLAKLFLSVDEICRQLNLPRDSELSLLGGWDLLAWAGLCLRRERAPEDQAAALWERIILANLQDYEPQYVYLMLTEALTEHFTAGNLWCLRGMLELEQRDFTSALASLQMAATHKASKLDVTYARGLLFTVWRRPVEAIAELTSAIENPQLDPAHVARAWSARAFARFADAQTSKALAELAEVELDIPDNAWVHYYRGHRYEWRYNGHMEISDSEAEGQASVHFKRALGCKKYPLTRIKREQVQHALEGYPDRKPIIDMPKTLQKLEKMR